MRTSFEIDFINKAMGGFLQAQSAVVSMPGPFRT